MAKAPRHRMSKADINYVRDLAKAGQNIDHIYLAVGGRFSRSSIGRCTVDIRKKAPVKRVIPPMTAEAEKNCKAPAILTQRVPIPVPMPDENTKYMIKILADENKVLRARIDNLRADLNIMRSDLAKIIDLAKARAYNNKI